MNYGIDSQIQSSVDAYRDNPQALAKKYQMNQELVDLLALQKLKSDKEAAARQMQMQASPTPTTIADQREQEVLGMTRNEIINNVGGAIQHQTQQAQQRLQNLAGLGGQSAPNVKKMASGGIVGYAEGETVAEEKPTGEDFWIGVAEKYLREHEGMSRPSTSNGLIALGKRLAPNRQEPAQGIASQLPGAAKNALDVVVGTAKEVPGVLRGMGEDLGRDLYNSRESGPAYVLGEAKKVLSDLTSGVDVPKLIPNVMSTVKGEQPINPENFGKIMRETTGFIPGLVNQFLHPEDRGTNATATLASEGEAIRQAYHGFMGTDPNRPAAGPVDTGITEDQYRTATAAPAPAPQPQPAQGPGGMGPPTLAQNNQNIMSGIMSLPRKSPYEKRLAEYEKMLAAQNDPDKLRREKLQAFLMGGAGGTNIAANLSGAMQGARREGLAQEDRVRKGQAGLLDLEAQQDMFNKETIAATELQNLKNAGDIQQAYIKNQGDMERLIFESAQRAGLSQVEDKRAFVMDVLKGMAIDLDFSSEKMEIEAQVRKGKLSEDAAKIKIQKLMSDFLANPRAVYDAATRGGEVTSTPSTSRRDTL